MRMPGRVSITQPRVSQIATIAIQCMICSGVDLTRATGVDHWVYAKIYDLSDDILARLIYGFGSIKARGGDGPA